MRVYLKGAWLCGALLWALHGMAAPQNRCARALAPDAATFQASYPHDLANLMAGQTLVKWGQARYILQGYDPKSRTVTLGRHEILQGKVGDTVDGVTITEEITALPPGSIVRDSDGSTLELLTHNAHGTGKTFFRVVRRRRMAYKQFRKLIKKGIIKTEPLRHVVSTPHPSLWRRASSSEARSRFVPIIGTKNVRLLNTTEETRVLDVSTKEDESIEEEIHCVVYHYELTGGADGESHQLEVITPKIADASTQRKFEKRIPPLLAQTPRAFIRAMETLVLLPDHEHERWAGWAQKREGRRHSTLLKKTIYSATPTHTFWHEIGHLAALQLWGSTIPPMDWFVAMAQDRSHTTAYAQKNLREDFAESFEEYIKTDGGARTEGTREAYAHRFAILDRLFGVSGPITYDRAGKRARAAGTVAPLTPMLAVISYMLFTLTNIDYHTYQQAEVGAQVWNDRQPVETVLQLAPPGERSPELRLCPDSADECLPLSAENYVVRCHPHQHICGLVGRDANGDEELVHTWFTDQMDLGTDAEIAARNFRR